VTAIAQVAAALLLFPVLMFGPGWAVAARLPFPAVDRVVAAVVCSVAMMWLAGWGIYTTGIPWSAAWILPPLAVIGIAIRARELQTAWSEPAVRQIAAGFGCIAAWCVGWLALVESYSGGGWSGDWLEHWQRAEFFLERRPLETLLIGAYPLPARPPLANVVTATTLALTGCTFFTYQIVTTLFSALAFVPAAALALRWNRGTAIPVLTLLFLANPLFVQNATFPWTKLPTAMLVLASLHFFLRSSEPQVMRPAAILFSVSMAAAILAHYSAGPYALMLAVLWFFRRPSVPVTLQAGAAGGAILATWFAWSIAHFGVAGTALSNSSVTTVDTSLSGQVGRVLLNLKDTFLPHFLRGFDKSLIDQTSPWGYARDWFFQLYQLNLLFALGSFGWVLTSKLCVLSWRDRSEAGRGFWVAFVAGAALLGVAVHGARDEWGLAHICLQPLVLLGLAFIAGQWHRLAPSWKRLAVAGGTVDLLCGIVLHFGVQNFAFDRWLTPTRPAPEVIASYHPIAQGNLVALARNQLTTVHEALAPSPFLVLALLAVILILAVRRTRQS
jgi:hypothetical protein